MKFYIVILSLGFLSTEIDASELEKFAKCYAQITGQTLSFLDSRIKAVEEGTVKAVDACMDVLETALLNADGQFIDQSESSKHVLAHFHALHNQWFIQKDINTTEQIGRARFGVLNIYDTTAPAAYFTRALFATDFNAESVLKDNGYLIPRREDMDPAEPHYRSNLYQKSDTAFGSNMRFAPKGDLLGFAKLPSLRMSWSFNVDGESGSGTTDFSTHFGGGVLGHPVYLMRATQNDLTLSDGGEIMPRTFGRDVYSDLLCRDLPAVRNEDAQKYVDEASPVAFRNSVNCAVCHASMDQTTGVIRNLKFEVAGHHKEVGYLGSFYLDTHKTTMSTSFEWSSQPDADYYKKETKGRFLFRSFDGTLHNNTISSLNDLAESILGTNDYYVCYAKRYVEYFTGSSPNIADIDEKILSDGELTLRKNVIALGKEFKNHKDLLRLIRSILDSPIYSSGGTVK